MASATIVTLPQMVDLALNSPEVGIVNFTVLHSLLHVIVKQLDLVDTNVEFRGSDSERLQSYIANAKPGPLLTLTEYVVGEDGTEEKKGQKAKKGLRGIVEKGKADEQQSEKGQMEKTESGRVIVVESSKDLGGGPVVVTKHHFDKLEDNINTLSKKVKELSELPANSALIEVLRSENPETTPVLDMFQILNLTKRLDAAELGMQKLASLMEDIAKRAPQAVSDEIREAFDEVAAADADEAEAPDPGSPVVRTSISLEHRLEKLEKAVLSLAKLKTNEGAVEPDIVHDMEQTSLGKGSKKGSLDEKHSLSLSQKDSPPGKKRGSKHGKKHSTDTEGTKSVGGMSGTPAHTDKLEKSGSSDRSVKSDGVPNEALLSIGEELSDLKTTVQLLNEEVDEIKNLISGSKRESENLPPELRLHQLEIKLTDCLEQLNSLDHMFCRQVEILQKRITDLEKDTGEMAEKVNLGIQGADSGQPEGQSMGEMYAKLLQIQEEMIAISENAQKLMEDREEKQHRLDVMLEQIELLKTVKADREDLEDALADKADACLVNRKVSVEQFDAACGDMSRAIEDSLAQLSQQEKLWCQALEEIQKEIGNKLDKMELVPLRDYINKKLKTLQDKFKSLTALKRDHEAAGTKSKILRNVNCISCDKDVVMRKEVDSSLFPKAYALPPTKNMAPYLAYELDQLRKQQKQIPPKKDLNMFENALKTAKAPKSPDHLCNRYCGGSHTVTTPQQRVTRLGHFLEQWGPEITTANDTMILGSDGHMYRGREDKAVFPVAPVESKPSQSNTPVPEEVIISVKMTSLMAGPQSSTARASSSSGQGQTKFDEEQGTTRKKSSVKTRDSDGRLGFAGVTGTAEPAQSPADEEDVEVRPTRFSDGANRKGSKAGAPRKRSKGSVKYASRSSRASGEIKVTEIPAGPAEKIMEETFIDAEADHYPDPEA